MTTPSRPSPPPGKKRQGKTLIASAPSANEALLHELRVHQIELEMQHDELRRTQLALEESRDRYVDLYEFAPIGYLTLSSHGAIAAINLTGAVMLGRERARLIAQRFATVVVAGEREYWQRYLAHALRHPGKHECELELVRGDGSQFVGHFDGLHLDGGTSPMLRLALTDTSRQRQAEADLRQLAVEATLAEERERRAIAADLHDSLGQTLHVTRIKLGTLVKGLPDGHAYDALVGDLNDLLTEASRMVRSLTSQLSPPALRDFGLVPALSWLAEEIHRTYGLTVTLEDDGAPKPLTQAQAAILFRAVRELLINVSKHASVDSARISVRASDGRLFLSVADKGIGMGDWQAVMSARKGFGLASVRERILFLKGVMDVQAHPGGGTVVVLEMPFVP